MATGVEYARGRKWFPWQVVIQQPDPTLMDALARHLMVDQLFTQPEGTFWLGSALHTRAGHAPCGGLLKRIVDDVRHCAPPL
jgi:hypothetical protein